MVQEDFDIFMDKFCPIEHPEEESLFMLDTHGEDFTRVQDHWRAFGPKHIWTVVDEEGTLYLTPGLRYVNRFGYVLTTVPWEEGERDYLY